MSSSFSDKASDIFLWRDPLKAGLAFGTGNLLFFLRYVANYSFVTLFSYLCLVYIVLGFVVARVTKALKPPAAESTNPESEYELISTRTVESTLTTVAEQVNVVASFFRRVALAQDIWLTVKVAVGLYFAAQFGKVFSDDFLIYLTFVGVFTMPLAYTMNKALVDGLIITVNTQVSNVLNLVHSSIPKAANLKSKEPVKQQ
eukprot:GILK01000657.1.p1 GENE.GILK01000657.1~~GILK01000657.1.p1  ORF type:complete len:230 (-),score=27.50 GILK01000657.1:125-727(-)